MGVIFTHRFTQKMKDTSAEVLHQRRKEGEQGKAFLKNITNTKI